MAGDNNSIVIVCRIEESDNPPLGREIRGMRREWNGRYWPYRYGQLSSLGDFDSFGRDFQQGSFFLSYFSTIHL